MEVIIRTKTFKNQFYLSKTSDEEIEEQFLIEFFDESQKQKHPMNESFSGGLVLRQLNKIFDKENGHIQHSRKGKKNGKN